LIAWTDCGGKGRVGGLLAMRNTDTRPKRADSEEPLFVLLADHGLDNYSIIWRVCERNRWQFRQASDRQQALSLLATARCATLITGPRLPGGEPWQVLLEESANLPSPSVIIIAAHLADEALWAEVLNLGGYDVLAMPFDEDEVERVLSAAYHHLMYRRTASG
jgi:DNA-binding NtrC family response regulator